MKVDSFDEIRFNKEYILYIVVAREFVSEIRPKLRKLLAKLTYPLNSEEPNLAPVKLSSTGDRPVTYFGTRMQIRGREAAKIARFANRTEASKVFVWLLDTNEIPLWKKDEGFNPVNGGAKPHREFVKSRNLKRVRDGRFNETLANS